MKAIPWKRLSSSVVFQSPIFSIRQVSARSGQRDLEKKFVVLDSADWVNVIALTQDEQVVLIRQYRHGTEQITTEIPGGVAEKGEDPMTAARRELLEETGYDTEDWKQIGVVEPNPAFQVNRAYTFLAQGVRKVAEPQLDESEEIEVEEQPLSKITELIADGTIRHSLVLCAFYHLARLRGSTGLTPMARK